MANAGLLGVALLGLGGILVTFLRTRRRPVSPQPGDAEAPDEPKVHLTPREQEILTMIGQGLTTKQIARDLAISPKTVEFHRGHLLKKFEANTMAEVVQRTAG